MASKVAEAIRNAEMVAANLSFQQEVREILERIEAQQVEILTALNTSGFPVNKPAEKAASKKS